MQGSRLVVALAEAGHDVLGIDNLSRGKVVPDKFWEADCRDQDAMDDALAGREVVYHLAAELGGVEYAHAKHWGMLQNNVLLDQTVFRAAVANGVQHVIYPSSACIYPVAKQQLWDSVLREEDAFDGTDPESGYGWGKLMGEVALKYLPVPRRVVLRLFNVYGPTESGAPGSHVIPELIRKVMDAPAGGTFEVYGDGSAGRSFCWVDDVVEAYVRALRVTDDYTVMNVGNPDPVRISDLAFAIAHLDGRGVTPTFNPEKPTGVIGRTPDIFLAQRVLGWQPSVNLAEGLKRMMAFHARRP